MKDYVAENERILNEWREKYVKENQHLYPKCPNLGDYFANDGIMFMGEIVWDKNKCRWKRSENKEKENAVWDKEPLRILYLTKDQNTGYDVAWDARSESFINPRSDLETPRLHKLSFFRNLVYSLYGILNSEACRPMLDFSDEEALSCSCKHAFARINCKKEVGEDKCPNDILKKAIDNDKEYLKQQIDNLNADIFFCCGYSESIVPTGSHILNFLNEIGYNFEQDSKEETGEWIYYDKKSNKVAINSYHLSYSGFDYNGLITAYSKFLKNHPDFMNSHRKSCTDNK